MTEKSYNLGTSGPATVQLVETVQPVHMNIYQTKPYTKNLNWAETQQLMDQQSDIPVSVDYPTYQNSNWDYQPRHDKSIPSTAHMVDLLKKKTLYNETRLQFS